MLYKIEKLGKIEKLDKIKKLSKKNNLYKFKLWKNVNHITTIF